MTSLLRSAEESNANCVTNIALNTAHDITCISSRLVASVPTRVDLGTGILVRTNMQISPLFRGYVKQSSGHFIELLLEPRKFN